MIDFNIDHGVLFITCTILSICYHYIDRYIETGERLLNNKKNIWQAVKITVTMFVGSTIWASLYTLEDWEVIVAGFALGLAAFSRGVAKFGHK